MIARIFKTIVIVMVAVIVFAVWASNNLFNGINLGGAGHSNPPGMIDKYKARKLNMDKMEQL
ncbi:sel1 repeat family protein, partial [Aggregatibacter actinomycetemcomitans]|nr:sel1 repeat family protein [Aggregatibacter actinomycetemcomitans]MBN6081096.1 sel1 repeat family protein [Aggregatibacter actinomycetemcomitans]